MQHATNRATLFIQKYPKKQLLQKVKIVLNVAKLVKTKTTKKLYILSQKQTTQKILTQQKNLYLCRYFL